LPGPTSEAWERLFQELALGARLAETGLVEISAEQIKATSQREPRLMTKFDTRESRPAALAGVTILPLTNGSYALLRGDGYADVPAATAVKHWTSFEGGRTLVTLPWRTGPSSESQALDMAVATGLLQDFLGEPDARLTIRGRLRAPRFEFRFRAEREDVPLTCDGVQVEVDSGFEGQAIHLVEAKLGTRTNFHVRQLYYPLRMWSALVPRKPVTAAFLSYSNRCFSLRSFRFEPSEHYHAILPVAATDYLLDEPSVVPSLAEIHASTRVEPPPPGIPFPQADELSRVIDVVDAVAAAVNTRAEIALRYEFDERQSDYYANAAAYLGLVTRTRRAFELTEIGRDFMTAKLTLRHILVLRQIAARPVFRAVLERVLAQRCLPSTAEVAPLIAEETGLSGATPLRRAGTVLAWLRWAAGITNHVLAEPVAAIQG
jgi:hypothetical protein